MPICDICGKELVNLKKHKERKTPCKSPTQLIQKALGIPQLSTTEFRESSKAFNKSLTKDERSDQGIYFTPKKVRELLFSKLKDINVKPKKILEPSFGTGEFLLDAKCIYPTAELFGVEKNEKLFKSLTIPGSTLTCSDFLSWKGSVDLIVGNPPYFVDSSLKNTKCMTGRPNIYIRFLYKCLTEHLDPDGYLAFIIPTSLYNCSYYQPMRNYIQENTTIHWLENLHKPGFYETGQDTMLIILQKTKSTKADFIFKPKNGNVYLSPFYKELYTSIQNTHTLKDLDLGAKTGNVVWNQEKPNLSDEGTLLIYSSNIKDSKLVIGNPGKNKKQYIKNLKKPLLNGPVILVERGYGNSFSFNSVLVEEKNFYAENHINVIYPKNPEAVQNLKRVIKSFQDGRTLAFVKMFLGNGTISATDLETLIPIY